MQTITIEEGLTFYSKPCNVITVLKRYNDQFYQVEDKHIITGDSRNDILLTPEAIQKDLHRQEEIQEGINKALKFEEQQQALAQEREQQEQQDKIEYEAHGYCNNMSPLQKGKVLKTLNKEERYEGKIYKRKDFIQKALEEGRTIKLRHNVKRWNRNGIVEKENYYCIENKDKTFYEITKTEYNYGMYLIENILQTV